MLRISYHKKAAKKILKLNKEIAKRITEKIEWISANYSTIYHEKLSYLPKELQGLCKYRLGDYRILYFLNLKTKELQIYTIMHRSEDYKIF